MHAKEATAACRQTQREAEGQECGSDAATNQGTPEAAGSWERLEVKPYTSDWDLNPRQPGLEPGQNPQSSN